MLAAEHTQQQAAPGKHHDRVWAPGGPHSLLRRAPTRATAAQLHVRVKPPPFGLSVKAPPANMPSPPPRPGLQGSVQLELRPPQLNPPIILAQQQVLSQKIQ